MYKKAQNVSFDVENGVYSRGPLYDLLKKAFPQMIGRDGFRMLNLKKVAERLEYTHEGICKPVRANKCSPNLAKLVVKKARGRVKLEEFYPFVMN
jgi:hypothetical protein